MGLLALLQTAIAIEEQPKIFSYKNKPKSKKSKTEQKKQS